MIKNEQQQQGFLSSTYPLLSHNPHLSLLPSQPWGSGSHAIPHHTQVACFAFRKKGKCCLVPLFLSKMGQRAPGFQKNGLLTMKANNNCFTHQLSTPPPAKLAVILLYTYEISTYFSKPVSTSSDYIMLLSICYLTDF